MTGTCGKEHVAYRRRNKKYIQHFGQKSSWKEITRNTFNIDGMIILK